jgi:hypothetical protein
VTPVRLILGLDLGQSIDHSALCGVEKVRLDVPVYRRKWRYVVRLLDEFPLGVSYPAQVKRACATLGHPALKGSRCGVDYTGVGRPVYDMMKDARPPVLLYPVLTTSGHNTSYDPKTREVHVPKTELVSLLQVLLQADLVNWHPTLAAAPRLKDQLAKFRVKITKAKNQTFGAEAGSNDDLVTALATACWLGEHTGGGDWSEAVVPGGESANRVEGAPAGVYAEAAKAYDAADPRVHGGGR